MALYYTLPVYKELYKFIRLMFFLTTGFPREYKYTIGQDIKRDGMQLMRYIYRANVAQDKAVHLSAFIDEFELLKFEVRICHDLRLINTKRYAEIMELMDSIGRQITGWRNAYRK